MAHILNPGARSSLRLIVIEFDIRVRKIHAIGTKEPYPKAQNPSGVHPDPSPPRLNIAFSVDYQHRKVIEFEKLQL
jgi:hypothetical protein